MVKKRINVLTALLLLGSASLHAGITGSPHDLSNKVSGNTNLTDAFEAGATASADNGEICVYCHTPHGANTAFTGAPLWNKADAQTTAFKMYGAGGAVDTAGTTIAGTTVEAAPASPSLACLSCHDGISAIDSIVNAPGSGFNAQAGGFTVTTALTTAYGGNIGGGTATGDLSNDHPVSVEYLGDGTATSPASLRATTFDLSSYGDNVAWVGATTIANLLRNGNVECGSCHDPHNGGKDQGVDTEVNFLRHSNTNSNLCIGCHDK